jgi:glutamine amidotransferase
MNDKIVILDYQMGNIFSIEKILKSLGKTPIVSNKREIILSADKIILPGVGHFSNAMNNLKKMNLIEPLNFFALEKKKPILGICLGMQLMAEKSEEGDANGLGWIDAIVKKFSINNKLNYKVPQMGWNTINIKKESLLMKNIPDNSEFYFIHSYYVDCRNEEDILNTTKYESNFVSATQKNNIFGVQYHPEKSHDSGKQVVKNFLEL